MADQTQRLEVATVRAEIGSSILYRFSNDDVDDGLIPTESGDITNLKKVILDIQTEGANKISFATSIYPTVAAGLAASTDGGIFLVRSDDPEEIYAVYANQGGAAVDTGKRALSGTAITEAVDSATQAADAAQLAANTATERVAGFHSPSDTDPTTRDDGSALQIGDTYFNTTTQSGRTYSSTGWVLSSVSGTDLNTAIATREPTLPSGTATQFLRGSDKTFVSVTKANVGLSNVDNTSDANKPVSTATQTALDAKQSAAYGSTTIAVRLGNVAIPEQFGAVGNGTSDDTAAINAAIASGIPVEGLPGKVYAVSGNIQYGGSLFRLKNISLKQLTPGGTTARRTILYSGTGKVYLENVTVNRNGTGTGGALNDAAGIWIANATGGYIRNCEVYGNDYGNGIALISCLDVIVEENTIHDIVGGTSSAAAITDDSIQGIWGYLCGRLKVRNNKIVSLRNIWTGQASTPRYTRGISLGGCYDYEIMDNFIDEVDQGIDSSGGDNNRRGIYYGNIVNNCYTWGLKFANTCVDILVHGNRIRRAGCAGIVCSAPTSDIGVSTDIITQRIVIHGNEIDDSGFGGNWDSFSGIGPCGVLILTNATNYPGYPKGIKVRDNDIFGASGKMKHGVYNQTARTAVAKDWNESIGNSIYDATVAPVTNVNAALIRRSTATAQSAAADAVTALTLETVTSDPGLMSIDNANLRIPRSGWYKVDAVVRWNGSATGTCTQQIVINGVLPGDTEGQTTFPGSGGLKRYPVSYRGYFAKDQTVRLQVISGGVASGIVSASLSIEPCQAQAE